MTDEANRDSHDPRNRTISGRGKLDATGTQARPSPAARATFQAELDALRVREKAHTREGDAIAAARRRLPMWSGRHSR